MNSRRQAGRPEGLRYGSRRRSNRSSVSMLGPRRSFDVHRAVPADAPEVEEQPDVDDGHRERDERIRLERLAIADDAGLNDRLLLRGLRRRLLRLRQLRAVEAMHFFEEQELARRRGFVLL